LILIKRRVKKVKFKIMLVLLISASLITTAAAYKEMTLEYTINLTKLFPPNIFGAGIRGFATVYDCDGDGTNEIYFGSRRGDSRRFWSFNGKTGEMNWIYPPISEDGLLGDPFSKPTLVDVDNDGVYEIAFQGRMGQLVVLNHDGSVKWIWTHPGGEPIPMLNPVQALDTDGDGFVEFFSNDDNGYIYRVSHEGQLVWTSAKAGAANEANPTVGDVDGDGEMEVIWGSNDQFVYCVKASTGEEKWRFDTGAWMDEMNVIVADVNNDNAYEIIAYNDNPISSVFCLSWFGTEIWRWSPGEGANIRIGQAIADVDKDGRLDMVLSTDIGHFCIDIAGDAPILKWEINCTKWGEEGIMPAEGAGNMRSPYQLIIDIDGDDQLEAILISNGPNVTIPIVVDATTGELEAIYQNPNIKGRYGCVGVWSGDVDGDGVSEYMFGAEGNTHSQSQRYVLTLGGKWPAEAPWPEMAHSALPYEDQQNADWLTMKALSSNSLFFPIPEFVLGGISALALLGLLARKR
jgi:outer membrane protein assembly factor BamB